MSASRTTRNGTAARSIRVLLAIVASLVLAATSCTEAGGEETAADGSGALDEPAQSSDRPTPTSSGTVLHRDGEIIKSTGDRPLARDLVAQDPVTGEVRTIVSAEMLLRPPADGELCGGPCRVRIGSAAWSADGRWVAYQVIGSGCATGLWVTNGQDEPRQLTTPCLEGRNAFNESWSWSYVGAQLVVARTSMDGDALVIDPGTGHRTDLGETAGPVTSLAWSPDGTRIAYATRLGGGSVYSVSVDGGNHSLLASSVGNGSILWSPDAEHILIQDLHVMAADGSALRQLSVDGDVGGSSWSPDGTRLAYTTVSGGPGEQQIQIWIVPPDGSAPSLLFESAPASFVYGGPPVWSPDGAQIAFSQYTTRWKAVWLVANADGTGDVREIDELRYESWGGGSYFCGCYG